MVRHQLLSIKSLVECLEERPEPAPNAAHERTETGSDAGDEERGGGRGGGRGWDAVARRESDEGERGPGYGYGARRLQTKGPATRRARASWQLVYLSEPTLFLEDHLPAASARAKALRSDTDAGSNLPVSSNFAQLTALCAPRALLVFTSVRKHM